MSDALKFTILPRRQKTYDVPTFVLVFAQRSTTQTPSAIRVIEAPGFSRLTVITSQATRCSFVPYLTVTLPLTMFMLQAKWMIPDFLGVNVKTVFLPSVRVIFFPSSLKITLQAQPRFFVLNISSTGNPDFTEIAEGENPLSTVTVIRLTLAY